MVANEVVVVVASPNTAVAETRAGNEVRADQETATGAQAAANLGTRAVAGQVVLVRHPAGRVIGRAMASKRVITLKNVIGLKVAIRPQEDGPGELVTASLQTANLETGEKVLGALALVDLDRQDRVRRDLGKVAASSAVDRDARRANPSEPGHVVPAKIPIVPNDKETPLNPRHHR